MTKQALRLQLREKRKSLHPAYREEKDLVITRKLLELKEFKDADSVLFYVSTPEEVDTHEAIKESLLQGKAVFAPKTLKDSLSLHRVIHFEHLKLSALGILEPVGHEEKVEPSEIDLIVVPGLGFDKRGHRLGYGKGYYDRLLKATKGIKVGLAYEELLCDELPIEEHDVPLDLLLTDTHTYTF